MIINCFHFARIITLALVAAGVALLTFAQLTNAQVDAVSLPDAVIEEYQDLAPTILITNYQVSKQAITIGFKAINETDKSWMSLKYGMQFVPVDGSGSQFFSFIPADSFSLDSESEVEKEVIIPVEGNLSGDYEMRLQIADWSGDFVTEAVVPTVSITSDVELGRVVLDDCTIGDGDVTAELEQTPAVITVAAEEEFNVSCLVTNNTDAALELQKIIGTNQLSPYGKYIATSLEDEQNLNLAPGETAGVSFTFLTPTVQSKYVTGLYLRDASNISISSNQVAFDYWVGNPELVALKNVVTDPVQPQSGEVVTAVAELTNFSTEPHYLVFQINSKAGEVCATSENVFLADQQDFLRYSLELTTDCPGPQFTTSLYYGDGTLIDEFTDDMEVIEIAGEFADDSTEADSESLPDDRPIEKMIIYGLSGLIAVALIFIVLKLITILSKKEEEGDEVINEDNN
tara:strand:+ start:1386 stop:2759 length:1374 start_codon:yes stop_codon:yes gene_type:complete